MQGVWTEHTSADGPSPWASTYRTNDLAFFTDPATRLRIESMGFNLVGVRDVIGRP